MQSLRNLKVGTPTHTLNHQKNKAYKGPKQMPMELWNLNKSGVTGRTHSELEPSITRFTSEEEWFDRVWRASRFFLSFHYLFPYLSAFQGTGTCTSEA